MKKTQAPITLRREDTSTRRDALYDATSVLGRGPSPRPLTPVRTLLETRRVGPPTARSVGLSLIRFYRVR